MHRLEYYRSYSVSMSVQVAFTSNQVLKRGTLNSLAGCDLNKVPWVLISTKIFKNQTIPSLS
jgi:hypothetical protein